MPAGSGAAVVVVASTEVLEVLASPALDESAVDTIVVAAAVVVDCGAAVVVGGWFDGADVAAPFDPVAPRVAEHAWRASASGRARRARHRLVTKPNLRANAHEVSSREPA